MRSARARSCRSARTPARWASRCSVAKWLAEESAGQCGPCYLGLPAAARGMEDILNGGGPAALEALKQVAQEREAARRVLAPGRFGDVPRVDRSRRSRTTWPRMSSATAADGPWRACCRSSRAAGCRRASRRRRPRRTSASRQKIFVDWTLCRGHGLCADILPEVFELGADGFPTVAQAKVPAATRRRRRCARCAAARRWPCASRRTPRLRRPQPPGPLPGPRPPGPGQRSLKHGTPTAGHPIRVARPYVTRQARSSRLG